MTTRRQALKLLLGAGAIGAVNAEAPLSLKFSSPTAKAQMGTGGKTLIKVFLRGGADGINLFPPYTDNAYYQVRPDLAVAPPNGNDASSAIQLTADMGAHPALAPLMEIWDNGDLALAPATHMAGTGRSHFDNQRWIENGIIDNNANGYLGRFVDINQSNATFPALVAGRSGVAQVLRGRTPVTAIRDRSSFSISDRLWCSGDDCSDNRYLSMLRRLNESAPQGASPAERQAYEKALDMSEKLELVANLSDDYTPDAGGLTYSNDGFGNGLEITAQLIKAGVGLEVVAMDWSIGWDTHSGQLPNNVDHGDLNFRYHSRIREGANNMLAFYRDIADRRDDVLMIFGTEFGRTVRQNGSRGTDHGAAAAWWMIGGAVNGGVRTAWPGLAENQLENGRFLATSLDYRDMLGEALVSFLGAPQSQLADIFPGHSFSSANLINATGS